MCNKTLERKEHSLNISLCKPEPNASIWGCITGKYKWSEFLKPHVSGQSYKVDLNLQTVDDEKKTILTKIGKISMKELEPREKKMLQKRAFNKNTKSGRDIYVKNLISNSTFETNISNRSYKSTRQRECKGYQSIYTLKSPNSEGPNTMPLKFKDNVLHLYNVKGMKHKKIILQGVPASKMFSKLQQSSKNISSPLYLNSVNAINTISNNDDKDMSIKKCKRKIIAEHISAEQLALPKLISKIECMEEQIQSLTKTTTKIDEEVKSAKSLRLKENVQSTECVPLRRSSVVTFSYRRSHVLPCKKTTHLHRRKFKENKLLKSSNTVSKIKNSHGKKKSKSKLETNVIKDYCDKKLYSNREKFDMLAENLKLLIENKRRKQMRPFTHKLKPKNHIDYNDNLSEIPELLDVDLSLEDIKLNSELKSNINNRSGGSLELGNITINREHSFKINTFSHCSENYNHPTNPEIKNYANIQTSNLEMKNVETKSQENPMHKVNNSFSCQNQFLSCSNRQASMESCFNSQQSCFMTNKNILPNYECNTYATEFLNGKCGKESISVLNSSKHGEVALTDFGTEGQVECQEFSTPDTKFNITILINEKDGNSKKSSVFSKFENVSLIKSHAFNAEKSINTVGEEHQTKNADVDVIPNRYNVLGSEEIRKTCYKPVSCPGELDKVKIKCHSLNTSKTNKDEFIHNKNALPIVAKSENQIQEPLNKPYLCRKQRKALQKINEKTQKKQLQVNDSLRCPNFANFKMERHNQGDALSVSKTLQTYVKAFSRPPSGNNPIQCDNRLSVEQKNNKKNQFCSVISNGHVGDNGRNLGQMNLKYPQISADKTLTCLNKLNNNDSYNRNHFVCKLGTEHKNSSFYENKKMALSNVTPTYYIQSKFPKMKTTEFKTVCDVIQVEKNILSKNIDNEENSTQNCRFYRNIIPIEDLQNESICQQIIESAEQKFNECDDNWNPNRKCNLKMITSIINSEKMEENFAHTDTFKSSKTTYNCKLSSCSSSGNENQSISSSNKKEQTIKFQFSTLVDKVKIKKKKNYEFENGNKNDMCLPIKKCDALLRINDKDGKELQQYFSSLSNRYTSNEKSNSKTRDSDYDSSKNKQDEVIEGFVTCIRKMAVNRVVNEDKNKDCIVNEEVKEEKVDKKELNVNAEANVEIISQTVLEQFDTTNADSTDVESNTQIQEKCEYCKCKKKISEINDKKTNVHNENSIEDGLLSTGQNKFVLKNYGVDENFNLNLSEPLFSSPSTRDYKLKETRLTEDIIPNLKSFPDKINSFFDCQNITYSTLNNYRSKNEQYLNLINEEHEKNSLKPILVSRSNLFLSNEKKRYILKSPLSLKDIVLETVMLYNIQPVDASIFRHNYVDGLDNQGNNVGAFVTSPSDNDFIRREKYSPSVFNSTKLGIYEEDRFKQDEIANLRPNNILFSRKGMDNINEHIMVDKLTQIGSSINVKHSDQPIQNKQINESVEVDQFYLSTEIEPIIKSNNVKQFDQLMQDKRIDESKELNQFYQATDVIPFVQRSNVDQLIQIEEFEQSKKVEQTDGSLAVDLFDQSTEVQQISQSVQFKQFDQPMQVRQLSQTSKCLSYTSVLKSNKIKCQSDLRLSCSDSTICFPKISSCSSSNSTFFDNDLVFDNTLYSFDNQSKQFLKNLKEQVEFMKLTKKQYKERTEIMTNIYTSLCEFNKLSSDLISFFSEVYKTIPDSDGNMMLTESSTISSGRTLTDTDVGEENS